jgi:hypothetical protein
VEKGDRLYITHDQDEFKRLVNFAAGCADWDSARHAVRCGKVGVVRSVDLWGDDTLTLMIDGQDVATPWIPVNACSRRPSANLTALVEYAEEEGAIAFIAVSTDETIYQMTAPDKDAGYKSRIPVLMIKSSDAVLLRKHGSALIRDKCARCPCSHDRFCCAQSNAAVESA